MVCPPYVKMTNNGRNIQQDVNVILMTKQHVNVVILADVKTVKANVLNAPHAHPIIKYANGIKISQMELANVNIVLKDGQQMVT